MNLVFTCEDEKDFSVFKSALNKSKYSADGVSYNLRSFYFGTRSKSETVKLEREVQKIADQNNVSGNWGSEDLP